MSSLNSVNKDPHRMWYEVDPRMVGTTDKYLVMVYRSHPDIFRVYVDKNYFRRYTLDTMPGKLREHIAMIHSYDWASMDKDFYVPPLEWYPSLPEHMREIGWKTSQKEYCVVMDKNLLDELKGLSASNDALGGGL
jgi:hypothetical protein